MAGDIPLAGGRTNSEIFRRGPRVHRARQLNSDFVHAILKRFEMTGFRAVPRSFGIDENGRDVFEYIDGDVPAELVFYGDDTLVAASALIRPFHDASAALVPAHLRELGLDAVCHNDLSPCNFVFRQQSPVAMIDFDAACFGRKINDIAYAAWLWLQIGDEDVSGAEQRRRLAVFINAYGYIEPSAVVEAMLFRQSLLVREGEQLGNTPMRDWAKLAQEWTRTELHARF